MKQRPRTRETRQRKVVYETIRATHSHPTADWIFEKVRHSVPKISLGTVYRNLSVLKDEGMVREIYGNDRRAHYDATTTAHAHFICSECGGILDVHSQGSLAWQSLKELVGCEVMDQRVEFIGVCPACRHRKKADN
jgi:Fur family peroxide stress response transcriptional regulator